MPSTAGGLVGAGVVVGELAGAESVAGADAPGTAGAFSVPDVGAAGLEPGVAVPDGVAPVAGGVVELPVGGAALFVEPEAASDPAPMPPASVVAFVLSAFLSPVKPVENPVGFKKKIAVQHNKIQNEATPTVMRVNRSPALVPKAL